MSIFAIIVVVLVALLFLKVTSKLFKIGLIIFALYMLIFNILPPLLGFTIG